MADATYINKDCVGCRFYKQSGAVFACNYFEMTGHSRLSLYDYDIKAMPTKCEQREAKRKRGRPSKTALASPSGRGGSPQG